MLLIREISKNLLFPKSKIIFTHRHPYDTVLSCFQQTFEPNNAMSNFRSIDSTSEIYDLTMRMWLDYKDKLKMDFINSKYENLVSDFDKHIIKILDFLDLSWEENECETMIQNFIKGEKVNNKITYVDDIKTPKTFYGIGFDIHKLVKNKKLYLGGLKIPFHSGLEGHSDGDVILHAIIDSILGAIRKKDIGTYFPNTKKFKNIRSPKMLKPIIIDLNKSNLDINNLDINLICQKPRVSKYRDKIIKSVSKLTGLNENQINLKGKTVEKLGLIGKEKAIACETIISITKYD